MRYSPLKMSLVISAILALNACATTPQQPRTFDQIGQFSSYPLNTQSYRISYQAPNRNMSYGMAEEIVLLKSAQITVKQGFQYFKILNDPSTQKAEQRTQVIYSQPLYNPYRWGFPFYEDPFYSVPRVIQDPVNIAYNIEMFKENTQPHDAFDARLILQHLGQKYGVSATGETLQPNVNPAK